MLIKALPPVLVLHLKRFRYDEAAGSVNFIGMVLPGDELKIKIKHTAMRDDNFVFGVTTNLRGEKVLEGYGNGLV